jgi:hypothetical protein
MNARKIGSKVLGSLVAIAALSSLSGCVVATRPVPSRTVYVENRRPTVVVQPARTVYVRGY